MREYEQRQHPLRLLSRRLFSLVLLGLIVFTGVAVWNVYRKERETHEKREQAEMELQEMQSRKEELQAEIDYLRTDRGMEEELRKQFELGKEGEGLIVIVDQPDEQADGTAVKQGWWRSFMGLFGRESGSSH